MVLQVLWYFRSVLEIAFSQTEETEEEVDRGGAG